MTLYKLLKCDVICEKLPHGGSYIVGSNTRHAKCAAFNQDDNFRGDPFLNCLDVTCEKYLTEEHIVILDQLFSQVCGCNFGWNYTDCDKMFDIDVHWLQIS